MQPLKMTNDALVRALHIQKDYINGDGKITVKLADSDKDTAVQLLMLKPGVKLAQVNEENTSETIAYIAEIMCDKGGVFRANYVTDLSQADIQERKYVDVYAGAKGMSEPVKTSFICYDAQTVDNVLSAVREAQDGESIRKIIEGDILVNNVKANDVLHFWIDSESEYENLKDRAGACKLLKKETFTNLQQIRTAFDAAVLKQLEYEENVTAALQELNDVKWDEMSEKLFQYAALLELNLTSGYYSKLDKNGLIQIHKQLANTYTFVFGADINKYIDDAAKAILTGTKPEGGGEGGGGTKADTKMELSGISIAPNNDNFNTPEFSDLDGALMSAAKEPGFSVTGAPYPTHKKGEKPKFGYATSPYNAATAITTACRDKEAAMRLLNYGYTKEGHILYNFGTEGVSYTMKDGIPTYTELVTKNPDGLSMSEALVKYCFGGQRINAVQNVHYLEQYASLPQQQAAWERWIDTDGQNHRIPATYIDSSKSSEYQTKFADVDAYAREMFVKFVSGDEPISNFDNYIKQLKKIGLDDVIKMNQEAYDRFLKR